MVSLELALHFCMNAGRFSTMDDQQKQPLALLGNTGLLNLPKTAFLSSRKVSPEAVLRCCAWAAAQRDAGRCVISGFHSALERDVLRLLLKGVQPVVLVLARRLYSPQTLEREHADLKRALDDGRLLLVSTSSAGRANASSTIQRNRFIVDQADEIVVGSLSPAGSLAPLIARADESGKRITRLDSNPDSSRTL